MTSSNGYIFRVSGHLCGEFTGPVISPQKCQWRGALVFSLSCVWINCSVNTCEAGDFTRYRAHYDVTVMYIKGMDICWYGPRDYTSSDTHTICQPILLEKSVILEFVHVPLLPFSPYPSFQECRTADETGKEIKSDSGGLWFESGSVEFSSLHQTVIRPLEVCRQWEPQGKSI